MPSSGPSFWRAGAFCKPHRHCEAPAAPIEAGAMTSIASWNINSVRARIGIVEKFLREEAPDVLCLQETKVERSEEHTSELQSLMRISYAVFCLKKKTTTHINTN